MNVVLITGISGQDGAFLAQRYVEAGARVVGTSRTAGVDLWRLKALGVDKQVEVIEANLAEEGVVRRIFEQVAPDEVYHLAGESSVGASFHQPHRAIDFAARSALHMMEAIRTLKSSTRLLLGASIQCFHHCDGEPVTEQAPFAPVSPYAAGKTAAAMIARAYRESYNVFVATVFLGNHESRLRGADFVTTKVVRGAAEIARGERTTLPMGNLGVERDWGSAEEYVDVMMRALKADQPDEFVIGTGKVHRLEDFVAMAFSKFGLDWQKHVVKDPALYRPVDPPVWRINATKAERILGWKASAGIEQIINELISSCV